MIAAQDARHLAAAWVLIAGMVIAAIAYYMVVTGNASVMCRRWRKRRAARKPVDSVEATAAVRRALKQSVERDWPQGK